MFLGVRSEIRPEPKGVVLILSPWNFPINLTLGPLVGALAAGNTVMVKPSEFTPATSALMEKMIREIYPPDEVVLVTGGPELAAQLTALPFNHIFFTGSPAVGKKVMTAAAQNLCSVTLELGGKSPVVVDESANLAQAARRIAWVKGLNAGQVCITADYVLVHASVAEAFVALLKRETEALYGVAGGSGRSYCKMVSPRHYARMEALVEDALAKGAKVVAGGTGDGHTYEPTLLTAVTPEMRVMQEEIFGPVLPILTYQRTDEAVAFINGGEKPLGLYVYARKRKVVDQVLRETRSGAVVVNHTGLQFHHPNLPFGGSNNSGLGQSHGAYSFRAFSHEKSTMVLGRWPAVIDLVMPPYTGFNRWIMQITKRWL